MINDKKLDTKDICAIIKTCRNCCVKSFKLDGMSIEFDVVESIEQHSFKELMGDPIESLKQEVEVNEKIQNTNHIMDLEELMISDPIAYEKAVLDGDMSQETKEE